MSPVAAVEGSPEGQGSRRPVGGAPCGGAAAGGGGGGRSSASQPRFKLFHGSSYDAAKTFAEEASSEVRVFL